jgi:hypothetical protein
VRSDGSELTNTGHWESGYSDTKPRIKLTNFQFLWDGQLKTPGLCDAYVSRTLGGRTQIEVSDDLFLSYSSPLPQKKEMNE